MGHDSGSKRGLDHFLLFGFDSTFPYHNVMSSLGLLKKVDIGFLIELWAIFCCGKNDHIYLAESSTTDGPSEKFCCFPKTTLLWFTAILTAGHCRKEEPSLRTYSRGLPDISKFKKKIPNQGLRRALGSRQVQLLSMGGVIGVGLFYGAGVALKIAGPAVIIDYVIGGLIVAIVMHALGEMTVEEPLAGSFSRFANQAFGEVFGFLTGGMWWFFWVATVMSELAAIGLLIQYWFPAFPPWIPGLIALGLFVISNLFSVEVFGEVEFWFAVLKILAIASFIVLGVLVTVMGINGAGMPNLWSHGGFLPNGVGGVLQAVSLVVLGYSGVETLAVTAGETGNPTKAIPQAVSNVSWRIAILYIGSISVMLVAFSWTSLAGRHVSPYVLLFAKAGIPLAATIINIIIISSGLSSSNTGLYGGSRMLFSLAKDGYLPVALKHLSQFKVPKLSVIITGLGMSVGILITYLAPNSVYVWISSASAFAAIWTWSMILLSEITIRKRKGGHSASLRYRLRLWPILPVVGLILLAGMLLAIMTSPLTEVSVWSGVLWLVFLTGWWFLYSRKHAERNHDELENVENFVSSGKRMP